MGKVRTKVIETAIEPEKIEKIEEIEKEPLETEATQEKEIKTKKGKIHPPKKRSRRYKDFTSLIDKSKEYKPQEAIEFVKKTADTKFQSSIEAHINLGLSVDKTEHQIRISASLPHQTGKKHKILVFTNKDVTEIKKLDAEIGTESDLKKIEGGKIDFDKVIAESSWMPKLATVAKILGPKGLMPNPKSGTVTDNPLLAVKEFSQGRIELRMEKSPIIHTSLGRSNMETKQILDNLTVVITAIRKAKPEGFKKQLIKSVYLSSTMGPSIKVDPSAIVA